MLLLALDTCDARGSVALLDDGSTLSEVPHPPSEEYSSWLIPAIDQVLGQNGVSHQDLAGYAVASGPGSFTGVRVGLTTAKACVEVYSKPVFSVSRLAILANYVDRSTEYAAAVIDAQREQIFAALYRRESERWQLVGQECVIDAAAFFGIVEQTTHNAPVSWVSLDPELLTTSPLWQLGNQADTSVVCVSPPLASPIGKHVHSHMQETRTDALSLDANYVRRSDAEIFGKKAVGT